MKTLTRQYVSEIAGTFILVFFGCGTAMATGANVVATSLAFGLSIIIAAYSVSQESGCHLNPAVSFAMLVDGKIKMKDFIGYIVSQIAGSFIATAVLAVIVKCGGFSNFYGVEKNDIKDYSFGANGFGNLNFFGALIVEIVLTFVFITVILCVTKSKDSSVRKNAPVFIGIALTFVHLIGINLTGTSVNPARSIAPAFFAIANTDGSSIAQLWVFIVAPMAGAFLAVAVNSFFNQNND